MTEFLTIAALAFGIVVFACLVLPMAAYMIAKLARAGWLRGEQAAKNHHNCNHEGKETTDGIDKGTTKDGSPQEKLG